MSRIESGFKSEVLGQRADRVEMVDDPRQLREGQAAVLLGRERPEHAGAPRSISQVQNPRRRGRRYADHVKVARQIAGR